MSGQFALDLIGALQDPAVADAFRKARIVNYDDIADCVTAKLSHRLKKMEEDLAAKDEKITALEHRIEELELKADDQEQYSRRTSVRIYGVAETPGEDVLTLSKNIFKEMNLTPAINRVHRVGPPRNPPSSEISSPSTPVPAPRPILCQFISYPDKASVMKKRSTLSTNYSRVFVNEDLTRKRAKILFTARKMKREKLITDCWSHDGRIAIKDNNNKIIPIRKISELYELSKVTTTPKNL